MQIVRASNWSVLALGIVSVGALAACSPPAPEERLINVAEDVSDMQGQLQSLNEEIAGHEQAIQELREQRQQARKQLLSLEERLELRATDLAIFRAAQSALLDEPTLQAAAVVANVEDGVVTLTGSVATNEEKQNAVAIAKSVPGVRSTVVRLQLIDENSTTGN